MEHIIDKNQLKEIINTVKGGVEESSFGKIFAVNAELKKGVNTVSLQIFYSTLNIVLTGFLQNKLKPNPSTNNQES